MYISPNQSFYYNALNLSQDLDLSTSNLYLSKLINNGTHLIEKAKEGESQDSSAKAHNLDLDQQAQQSILNNEIGRRYEILFKHSRWQLNDDDGQTSCAQFLMKNILYTKISNQQELDCVEHTLEIESCKVQNLVELQQQNNNGGSSRKPSANKLATPNKSKKQFKQNSDSYVLKGKVVDSFFGSVIHKLRCTV